MGVDVFRIIGHRVCISATSQMWRALYQFFMAAGVFFHCHTATRAPRVKKMLHAPNSALQWHQQGTSSCPARSGWCPKKVPNDFPKSQYGFSMGMAEICTHRAKIMLPMFFSVANPFPKSIGMWLCSSHGLVAIILHFRILVPQFNTPE